MQDEAKAATPGGIWLVSSLSLVSSGSVGHWVSATPGLGCNSQAISRDSRSLTKDNFLEKGFSVKQCSWQLEMGVLAQRGGPGRTTSPCMLAPTHETRGHS